MADLPTACVIGAGSSGLTAVKALAERGIPFDCFEASDRVGGLWAIANGASSAYRSLHINTSRERMAFSDFPMPRDYPDFPHHAQVAAYFDAYADRFGLRERITFEVRVEHAARAGDGTWRVRLEGGETRAYDALLVANGHHWDPRRPVFPGQEGFTGRLLHAHDYRGDDPGLFRDKVVVVLGMGNSAMDIAVDASFTARATYLSARRGAWVIPKYVLGRPFDQIGVAPRIPGRVRRRAQGALLKAVVGEMSRYGLPEPDHRLGEAHPTISDLALSRLAHGAIAARPAIAAFEGERTVRFADGSTVEADVVVLCTGYKVSFPFFDPGFIVAPGNDLPLFRRVFHPEVEGVFFIGLLQPLGAVMPLAELQSAWVGDHLLGRYHLPPPAAVRADIEAERAAMFRRYVRSERHTMQVDFEAYVLGVERERRAGARRAARAGHALPVPARAATTVGAAR